MKDKLKEVEHRGLRCREDAALEKKRNQVTGTVSS